MKTFFTVIILFNLIFIKQLSAQKTSDEIAKKLANPVGNMISVPFQQNFDYNIDSDRGAKYTLNFQPVIPIPLGKSLNLINRVIVPFISQNDVIPHSNQTGLGDISYSAFFAPNLGKFILGLGPIFSIPSATDSLIGSKKLGIGPTLVAAIQSGKITAGALINNIWSVAGAEYRPEFNSFFIQPFINYGFNGGFTLGLISENSYDWKNKQLVSGMITLSASQVFKIGGIQTASVGIAPKYFYANSRVNKPEWGMRVVLTLVFAE